MSNDSNIVPNWAGFRKFWIIGAIALFASLLLLMLAGYSPWSDKPDVEPTIVEKEKLVDNPELLTKIGLLEKENSQISGLKANVADLTKSSGLVAGLQAKVKALEAVDLNFENPALTSRINLLETENASMGDMKKRIMELEATNTETNDERNLALTKRIGDLEKENGLIAGLKAKVSALEGIDLNFMKPKDDTKLLQKINNLEIKTLAIPSLESRIQTLQAEKPVLNKRISELEQENGLIAGLKAKVSALEAVDINFMKPKDDTALVKRIGELEQENGLIAGLKAKVSALEAVDINFMKPKDDTALVKRIGELEKENGLIAGLKAKVSALEAVDINFMKPKDDTALVKRIGELEKENGLIAGLKAKVSALEAVDINFMKPKDDTALVKRIGELEKENGLIAGLKAKVSALEAVDINFMKPKDDTALVKRIGELETQNGLIPGLQAKIKALEAIDINFMSNDSAKTDAAMMKVPDDAKLFFEPGSSRFPTDAAQSMADVIVYLRANPSSRVSLTGFHDSSGNANWNRRLANKRSNRVREILLGAGISENRISVQRPSQTLGSGSPQEARRVEVRVSK